jgi:aerobic carbon-monoxide dehydrogenase large subunit
MTVQEGAAPRFLGQRVQRREDSRFLRGTARFVDDIVRPRMLWASFVRSTEAHATITGIDADAALAVAGARYVITGDDLAERVRPIRCDSTMPTWQGSEQPALATGKVRFVGEPVACVLAEDRATSADAAELVTIGYERLPAVIDAATASAPGAPLLHDEWADNYFIRRHFETDGFEEAMAGAAHRLTRTYTMGRHSGIPLEPRGCIAEWDDAAGVLVLRTATQIRSRSPSTTTAWSWPCAAASPSTPAPTRSTRGPPPWIPAWRWASSRGRTGSATTPSTPTPSPPTRRRSVPTVAWPGRRRASPSNG